MTSAAGPEGLSRSDNSKPETTPINSDADSEPAGPRRVPYFWMLRPCEAYKDEYKDCKSFKDRFHQHFVHGEFRECGQWKVDHENCLKWEKTQDEVALQKVIESEKQRVKARLKAHYDNDVWEHREEPPPDWNKKLPEDILKSYEDSYLQKKTEELKSGQVPMPEDYIFSDLKCSIM